MLIGIVSKPEHCKPHMKALAKEGHEVRLLGGESCAPYPPSLDLIVCRPASCSHQAFWEAAEAKRNGERVIFENSVTKIVRSVRDEGAKVQTAAVVVPTNNPTAASLVEAAEDGMNESKIHQKLVAAIREVGLFHPKVPVSEAQLERLRSIGIVASVSKAKTAIAAVAEIRPSSWPRPFNALRKDKDYNTYLLWKVTGPEKKRLRTSYEMVSATKISWRTLLRVAEVLDMHAVEPKEGRAWPPNRIMDADSGMDTTSPVLEAAMGVAIDVDPELTARLVEDSSVLEAQWAESESDEMSMEELRETYSDISVIPCAPIEVEKPKMVVLGSTEPLAVSTETVTKPLEIEQTKPVEQVKPVESPIVPSATPAKTNKADIRELVDMLNQALLAANVTEAVILTSPEGAKVSFTQVVVRKDLTIEQLV